MILKKGMRKKEKITFKKVLLILFLLIIFIAEILAIFSIIKPKISGNIIEGPTNGLVAYYPLDENATDLIANNSGSILNGTDCSIPGRFGYACKFNGISGQINIPDKDQLSVTTTGQLSISFWINPQTFNFTGSSSSGYINYLGKGLYATKNQCEWEFRMYNGTGDNSTRIKRMSFYVFNQTCGLGTGSYFQDNLTENTWIHVVGIINGTHTIIYKNGVLRDSDIYVGPTAFADITPSNTNASMRIGTVQQDKYLNTIIDDVRVYNRALTPQEIITLYNQSPSPGALKIAPIICTSFTYSSWTQCNSSNFQSRIITSQSPVGCIDGTPENLIQSCLAPCTESNWKFTLSPSTCPITQQQTKNWTKLISCNETIGINKPSSEIINCSYSAPLTYNAICQKNYTTSYHSPISGASCNLNACKNDTYLGCQKSTTRKVTYRELCQANYIIICSTNSTCNTGYTLISKSTC